MAIDASEYILGIDIGGTCTDITLTRLNDDSEVYYKTETVPSDVSSGIVKGVTEILSREGLDPENCRTFVHGSTLALNTILTRTGANVGLMVTGGFGDILEMARMQMPDPYNLYTQKYKPLINRKLIVEVSERIGGKGDVLIPIEADDVKRQAGRLVTAGATAIVIGFINSYRNSAHEIAARSFIQSEFRDVDIWLSSELWPEIREYERINVTAMNAYVAPVVNRYLSTLRNRLDDIGFRETINITTSNGGMLPEKLVQRRPGTTVMSGPASGVFATQRLGELCGIENLLALDMGGTSTDFAAITGRQVPFSSDLKIDDFPLVFPSVEVISVGAGGGSVARLDSHGVLKVGPESAGADPGPVCYNRGGKLPTVTDAYVVTGIIDPARFLGGKTPLRKDVAEQAFVELAQGTGLTALQIAEGTLKVATSNLLTGIGKVEAAKGVDVRNYAMVAYGGAGPTHACLVAELLGIKRIIVPRSPGTFCATGAINADYRYDFVQSLRTSVRNLDWESVRSWLDEHSRKGLELLGMTKSRTVTVSTEFSLDLRYRGQGFEVNLILTEQTVNQRDVERVISSFHEKYHEMYGVADKSTDVEVVNIRLVVVGHTPKTVFKVAERARSDPAPIGSRRIYTDGEFLDCDVYLRESFQKGVRIDGPLLVDQSDTTVYVRKDWRVAGDEWGILHLAHSAAQDSVHEA